MKYNFQYKVLFRFFLIFSCVSSVLHVQAQSYPELKLNHIGYETKQSKPSISTRLNGASGVTIIQPSWMRSQKDKYVFQNLPYFFEQAGVRSIDIVSSEYEVKSPQNLIVQYFLKEDKLGKLTDYTNNVIVLPQLVSGYPDIEKLYLDFFDGVNGWSWRVEFEVPNKRDKYQKKFSNYITPQIIYNSTNEDKYRPLFYWFNWYRMDWFKQDAEQNGCDILEGVYEFDKYKCFLKQYNGKYYLVNLANTGYSRWEGQGEIKAIFTPTAAPNVFTCEFWNKYRVKTNARAGVGHGFVKIFPEDEDEEDTYTLLKTWPAAPIPSTTQSSEWSGTGFALKDGYIVTNYHVIDGANSIEIFGIKGDFNRSYSANVIASDKNNDLALLKISSTDFTGFGTIPYGISSTTSDVGEDIFVLGYPLTSTMGDEIKLTNGIISSKTGFQGDVSLYQISAPIQPGNSGGPLFNSKGNVIGIVSAKHTGAENVGYAIKVSYLRNLVESAVSPTILNTVNSVSTLNLPNKVKKEKNFVFYIVCKSMLNTKTQTFPQSSGSTHRSDISTNSVTNPSFDVKLNDNLVLNEIILNTSETILDLSFTNNLYAGWMSIDGNAHILYRGISYPLISASDIEIVPNRTSFEYVGQTKRFKLHFKPIPTSASSFSFIESPESQWQIMGIKTNRQSNTSDFPISYPTFYKVMSHPSFEKKLDNDLKLNKIICTPEFTILDLTYTNPREDGYMTIDWNSYLLDGGVPYMLRACEDISISPERTKFNKKGESKRFLLYFNPISKDCKKVSFIENDKSNWKIYGITIP